VLRRRRAPDNIVSRNLGDSHLDVSGCDVFVATHRRWESIGIYQDNENTTYVAVLQVPRFYTACGVRSCPAMSVVWRQGVIHRFTRQTSHLRHLKATRQRNTGMENFGALPRPVNRFFDGAAGLHRSEGRFCQRLHIFSRLDAPKLCEPSQSRHVSLHMRYVSVCA